MNTPKNETQAAAKKFDNQIKGEPFSFGSLLECKDFLLDYKGWEVSSPYVGEASRSKVLLQFCELLKNDNSGAFNQAVPEWYHSMYVLMKRNKNKEPIAGIAFAPMRIHQTLVCYVEVIIVQEDNRRQKLGTLMISMLKECLRSFKGTGNVIDYMYVLAQLSKISAPHVFFQKQGSIEGFPADFSSWKIKDLDQVYISVEPQSAKDVEMIVRADSKATTQSKGVKGKYKQVEKEATKKAKTTIEEIKAPFTPAKASKPINQKSARVKNTQPIKESAAKESETESTFSKMTSKTKSGAINKHCMYEKCQGKFISGINWGTHIKKVHEGANSVCNRDFFLCGGEECHLCQEYKGYQGKQPSYKCKQCGKTKRHDQFPKESKEVCFGCIRSGSSGSKGNNSSAEKEQHQLTQENLEMFDKDQHMNETYEDDGFSDRALLQETPQLIQEQYFEDKQTPANNNKLQISPLESISQVGQKRTFTQIEGGQNHGTFGEPTKRQETEAQSLFAPSVSASSIVVVAHTDLSVIQQLRQLESQSENAFVGAQTIQKLCDVFSQDSLVLYFMEPQAQFIADCIISSMKRCENLTDIQASGLVVTAFFIKGQCWQQAIKLINHLSSERRQTVLDNLRIVLAKHFNADIGQWVQQYYRYTDQQQINIITFFKESKINSFTDPILMLSIAVDAQNIPLFVKSASLFVETAPIAKLLLSTIAEKPVQTKMSYDAFVDLAVILQEKDYSTSVNATTEQLKVSKAINWVGMIKQQYESTHILDGESIQQFIDEYAGTYGKNDHLIEELTAIDDNFQMVIDGIVDNAPNKKQFAVAQYANGKLYTEQRQLWVVPSGQGKSRMIAAATLIVLANNMFSKVHLVYQNQHLCDRDRNDASSMLILFSFEDKVEYHIGYDFEPKANELIIVDEADTLIFEDPIKFRQFIQKNACLCFTATPETTQSKGLETKVFAAMNMKKYFYILEDEGKSTLVPEFDQKPDMPADLTEYISNLLQAGPVLLYGTNEQINALKQNGLVMVQVDDTTEAETLRNLDQQQENGKYTLVAVTDCKWMRGIDYRSKAAKMTLLVARPFDNYREAIQGFNRVGRFGDDCQRIIFKEVELIDKKKDLEYLKKLMQFSLLMSKTKVDYQPVVVQRLAPAAKSKTVTQPKPTTSYVSKAMDKKRVVQLLGQTTISFEKKTE